jgi:hypothetical protein
MYFGRWKAYEMMLRQEQRSGLPYSWVVHGRLDAAWASPVQSVTQFVAGKFYGPDLWYADVPDTFSIMSRDIADIYFSMDSLMLPTVLCLG